MRVLIRRLWVFTLILLVNLSVADAQQKKEELDYRAAKNFNLKLPNVLLVGDSICSGYSKEVIKLLAGKANVNVWITEVNLASPNLKKMQRSVLNHGPFDLIHFNMGLHGLENRVLDEEYAPLVYEFPRYYFNYSAESNLIWASTTPIRKKGTNRLDQEERRNPLIVKRNALAEKVLSRFGIPVNDLYSVVMNKLDLGGDDGVHWSEEGYRLMAEQVTEKVEKYLTGPIKIVLPTHKEVHYGPYERNVLNFWQAKSDKPTPAVMLIHGGGWGGGGKANSIPYRTYLAKGISVISISYRLLDTDILPAPVHDAARALQFVRSKAKEWNLDKEKIAVKGGSAGGASSLWLIYHDDLANPDSDDPVERESTKPYCAAVGAPQTCLDPFIARQWIGDLIVEHSMLWKAVGAKSPKDLLENYGKYEKLSHEFSAYFHIDKDDPPVLMVNHHLLIVPAVSGGHAIHHPAFMVKVKEKADQVGAECQLILRDTRRQNRLYSQAYIVSKLLGGGE